MMPAEVVQAIAAADVTQERRAWERFDAERAAKQVSTAERRRSCTTCGRLFYPRLTGRPRCDLCIDAAGTRPQGSAPSRPSVCLFCRQVARELTYDRCQSCLWTWRAQLQARHAQRPLKAGQTARKVHTHPIGPCVVCGRVLPIRGRGRCGRDYVWWNRHGRTVDRPVSQEATG